MAKIANVALTNTFDTWRSRSNEAFDRLSQFAINNSSLYANTLTANSSFTSKGLTTLQGRATVGTNLTVSGNTTFGGANKVSNTTGWFGVNGRASVGTNLFVGGNTTIAGVTTLKGFAYIGDASDDLITITGRVPIVGNMSVSGNTTLGGANKTVTMGGASSTLTIGGAGHVSNTTGWMGVLGRASISTNLFVGGNTTVAGTSTFNGPVNIGDASTDLLTITGRTTIAQNLNVSGNTTFGAANKTSNTIGWFGVNGRATVSTNLFVGGNTTLNGTTIDKSNALSQTLTDGATINWDVALGRVATVTLGAAGRTMAAPTNLKVGTYILRVYQDATGSRTITTWNSVFKWTAAVAPVLSTGANKLDIITFFSDGTNLYGSYLPDMR